MEDPCRISWYHGTTASFAGFEPRPPENASLTGMLGVFLSADPRIAAHFTLLPEVVDWGYASIPGSRSLIRDPWAGSGGHPFLEGATLLECRVRLANPAVITPPEWCDAVDRAEELDGEAWLDGFRTELVKAGHDGILIPEWDGTALDSLKREPSCEYDAPTLCVFSHADVTILARQSPGHGWLPEVRSAHPPLVRELPAVGRPPHLGPLFHLAMVPPPDPARAPAVPMAEDTEVSARRPGRG